MTTRRLDVESTANRRAKAWASLAKRSERDRSKTFLVEGARETRRAGQRLRILEIIFCPEYGSDAPHDPDAPITTVSRSVFDKISHRQNPDGVAAVASTPAMSLSELDVGHDPIVLVGDAIEKPGNIGAMLRSCDAFGASFIGSSLATDLVNPNVVRAAQGSLFTTPVADVAIDDAINWCSTHTRVVIAHPTGAKSLWEQDLGGAISIVVGSEHAGINPRWLEVGEPIVIPMSGTADSLNASVSAGVFLAEAVRQRSG